MSSGQVKKWGNSLAIRLPKEVIAKLNIADGMNISIEIDPKERKVTIRPEEKVIPSLEEMVKKITKENQHPLVDWGKPVGREAW